MIKLFCVATVLLLSGCVVSKQTYQTQYLETRELEAKNEDLTSSLSTQTNRSEELATKLEEVTEELSQAKRDNEHAAASLAEVRQRLERCQSTREELGTELDVSKKTVRKADSEQGELLAMMDKERASHKAELKRLSDEIDERDGRIEQLRSTISTVKTELDVINEQNELLEREKREKIDEMSKTYQGLLGTMEEEIEQGRVTISQLKGQLTVNLVDEILFPSGSSEVKEEGKEVLARLAEALIGIEDKMIVIEGHTDNVPIIGVLAHRFPTNWELSTARAVSVVRYLSATAGLDPKRLSAVGFGQYHPVSENETEEGRAKNRRIEIKLMPFEPRPDIPAPDNTDVQPENTEVQQLESEDSEAAPQDGVNEAKEPDGEGEGQGGDSEEIKAEGDAGQAPPGDEDPASEAAPPPQPGGGSEQ